MPAAAAVYPSAPVPLVKTAMNATRSEIEGEARERHPEGDAAPLPIADGRVPPWLASLGRSERGGRDEPARIEGRVPPRLNGSLYRNGPGLFERGGVRSRHLLDGDGLVQRLSIGAHGARYRNAFVRTPKFVAEEQAGRRLWSTWSTRRSRRFYENLGGGFGGSQAGVTISSVHGCLLARDEIGGSFEIDPDSLATLGELPLPRPLESASIKAHGKLDPETGEWILAGTEFGRGMRVHAIVHDSSLEPRRQLVFSSPRQVYIHDFFVTRRYLVFVLHPVELAVLPLLAGLRSFIDCLRWTPGQGNLLAVLPREGGTARFFEAPAAFMWHTLNAREEGRTILADFVGYDEPDHFLGPDALLSRLRDGRFGRAESPGTIRRYRIDLAGGRATEEILDTQSHEFPMIDPRCLATSYRRAWFGWALPGRVHHGIKHVDMASGASELYDFGTDTQVGEPVFAPRPDGAPEEGWLIVQGLDGRDGNAFFAILDAGCVAAGPLATIRLEHPLPMSFHGTWVAAP